MTRATRTLRSSIYSLLCRIGTKWSSHNHLRSSGTLVKNDADVSVTPNTFSSGLSLTDHIARFTLQFRQLSQKIGTWWNELRLCVSKMSRRFLYSWLFYGDGSHDNDVHIFQWKILADWPRFTEQEFANICCRNKKIAKLDPNSQQASQNDMFWRTRMKLWVVALVDFASTRNKRILCRDFERNVFAQTILC